MILLISVFEKDRDCLSEIVTNEKGQKVVEIDTIVFSGKRKIDWDGVEQYLKRYVGQKYRIDETDDLIYIGSDFPDEYANSKHMVRKEKQRQMRLRLSLR